GEYLGVEREPEGKDVVATIRRRGLTETEELQIARVYDCGGVSVNIFQSSNPLIQRLVASGRVRPDPLRIGIEVTPDCAVVDADRRATRRICAGGPLPRSQVCEIESVPDFRVQAAELAHRLVRHVPAGL